MGLIDRLGEAFGVSKAANTEGEKITPTGYEAAGVNFMSTADSKQKEYLEEMRGWVGACVTALADQVASIDLKLMRTDGDKVEEITDHPILDLLFRVNSFTSRFDHFWLTQAYLELTGEAPWFLEKDSSGITNIFFLRPDKLKPQIGKSRLIEGYKYEVAPGQNVDLEIDEVLFLKYPNPSKPFRGIGTLQMAALTVDIDNYSEEWNKDFYANSARPDSILNVKNTNLDNEQKKKLIKSFKDTYSGRNNAHKTMLLFGDIEFNKAGFSQRDMDFLEQQKFSRDKILGIFRVPKAVVSQTEGVNFASAKTAEYIFAKYTVKPKMERLVQQLNEFLLPMFPDAENMFLDFASPVPSDSNEDMGKYDNALRHGWMTINEVREEQGMEPVEGGDEIHIPSNMGTVNENQALRERVLHVPRKGYKNQDRITATRIRGKRYFKAKETKAKVKKQIKSALTEQYKKEKGMKPAARMVKENEGEIRRVLTEQEIKTYWDAKNKIFEEHQEKLKEKIISVFKRQRKAVLTKLSKKQQSSDDFYEDVKLDVDKEAKKIMSITIPALTELFKEAGEETLELLQLEAEMDVESEEVQNIINSKARLFAVGMTEATNEFIRQEVTEGLANDETIPQLRNRIVNVFDEAESYRAERVARTETARYNTAASEQAFVESGIVEGKMWVTDPDPCPYCATLAGKTASLGSTFVNKGDTVSPNDASPRTFDYDDLPRPPMHPNCQCDIVPIFVSQKIVQKK